MAYHEREVEEGVECRERQEEDRQRVKTQSGSETLADVISVTFSA